MGFSRPKKKKKTKHKTGGIAIAYSRGSSQPRDWTCILCFACTGSGFFITEPPGKPVYWQIHSSSHCGSTWWVEASSCLSLSSRMNTALLFCIMRPHWSYTIRNNFWKCGVVLIPLCNEFHMSLSELRQGGLACCDSWGCKELDTTERLSWAERTFLALPFPVMLYDKFKLLILIETISSHSWKMNILTHCLSELSDVIRIKRKTYIYIQYEFP